MADIKDIDGSMGNILDFQVLLMDMMGSVLVSQDRTAIC
jgi:hypothetical protein